MTGADHTFIFGLANDEIGYQVPFAKWDNSCHECAPYIIARRGGVLSGVSARLQHRLREQRRASRSIRRSPTRSTPLLDALH